MSDDSDASITTLGTMRWIQKMGWKIEKEYSQWKNKEQVAGFYQVFENGFTFVTVKGAGHMASSDKRPEMKILLDAFITGSFKE